jgi:hypothetical protein
MTIDDRYQFQPWYIKAKRWLQWRPLYLARTGWHVLGWIVRGARPVSWTPAKDADTGEEIPGYTETRRETFGHIIGINRSMAQMKMRHYFTADEVLEDLRAKP